MADKKNGAGANGAAKGGETAKESKCPVTMEQFMAGSKPIIVEIDGQRFVANPKEFSTGSFGYFLNGKLVKNVGDTPVSLQIGLNLTVVGSKEAARK